LLQEKILPLGNNCAADVLKCWLVVFNRIPQLVDDRAQGGFGKKAKKVAARIKEIKKTYGKASRQTLARELPSRSPSTSDPAE
jgi:hypothetical protein